MASILPQCSWCGGDLEKHELRKSREEILERWEKDKKEFEHKKAWKSSAKRRGKPSKKASRAAQDFWTETINPGFV